MGSQFHCNLLEGNKLKLKPPTMSGFVTLFALVAAAFAEPEANAEADPQLLVYGAHTTGGLVHHPLSGAVTPDDTAAVKVARAQHLTARAQHLTAKYGLPLTYSAHHVAAAKAVLPLTYTYPSAYPYTYSRFVKREAEAEADADPAFYYNNAYNTYPFTYGYPSATYTCPTYATGCTPKTVLPYTAAKTVLPYTYRYPTYTTGARLIHNIHKREAEADPYTFYNGVYGLNYGFPYTSTGFTGYKHPYTYSTVAAHPAYTSAYTTYPYAAYHY